MKKILTGFTNGHKFTLADYEHLQESYTEIIDALVKAQTSDSTVRLHGAQITVNPSSVSVTSGAIYHNGEIFLVDAQTLSGTGTPYYNINESFRSDNPIEFKNPPNRNVHVIRKLVLSFGSGDFATSSVSELPTYALQSDALSKSSGGTVTGPLTIDNTAKRFGRIREYMFVTSGDTDTLDISFSTTTPSGSSSNFTSHFIKLLIIGRNDVFSSGPIYYESTHYFHFSSGNTPSLNTRLHGSDGATFSVSTPTFPTSGGGNVTFRWSSSNDMKIHSSIYIMTDVESPNIIANSTLLKA